MKKQIILLLVIGQSYFVYSQFTSNAENKLLYGEELYSKGNYQEAILQFKKCIAIFKKSNENQLLGKTYNNLGRALSQTGNSEEALTNYLLSLLFSKQTNDNLGIAKTYKNIGALYAEQKDFENAMHYYNSSFKLSKQLHNLSLMADCQNNMGVVYEQQIKYNKALQMYSKALAIYISKGDEQKISMVYNNLAIVYKYLKNYPEAIKNYKSALILSEKLGDQFMVAANQNNLGNVYALTHNYQKSLELCKLANTNAKAINAQEVIIESYDGISIAYEKLDQFTDAIKYRKLYELEKDNYINSERSDLLAEKHIKYETQKKVDEIKLLNQAGKIRELKIKEQDFKITKKNHQITAFIILLLGLISIAYFWKKSQKFKNQLINEKIIRETEEQERIRIAKDIHDDLGSGLTKINFLSEIIFQKTHHLPEIRNNSESVKETAKKLIDNMRDLIWALNPDNSTIANLLSRMREYATDYLEDYPIELHNFFPENLPETPITKEANRELFMVVKECLNNIVKHSKATDVFFTVNIKTDDLTFSIKDNGIGLDCETDKKGNGLLNMQSRLLKIGGICSVISEPNNGTLITITYPLNQKFKNN
ncbi:tetratricopeptide repeat-containing sensor histidine kinase [Flavobacterium cellulosilyticum]|uniref:Tetratricopeptide repeat protein n=1 Tax=Flavobacterium cellulosilyticum TaxID=2541731 RepID=A0A4R5CM43_9FLAO|nr:sensor histidine kinase [Flavobacterium cellulosilyticum]TDD98584.1 tetratricopeptide repeat protein [Flavobacterium cellulosilyticum]